MSGKKYWQVLNELAALEGPRCSCGEPLTKPKSFLCEECAAAKRLQAHLAKQDRGIKEAERRRKIYQELRAKGICTRCQLPSDQPKRCKCSKCEARDQARAEARNKERVA